MALEYFWYTPVIKANGTRYPSIDKIIKEIPPSIKGQLLQHPVEREDSIIVETRKKAVVDFLDSFLKVRKNEFDRSRHIEITEADICKYDYYYIGLRVLTWGQQITYEFNRPTCNTDGCPVGAEITSPVTIRLAATNTWDLAAINDIWRFGVRFAISERLKDSFNSMQITGLGYTPCSVEVTATNQSELRASEKKLFIAEITSKVMQRATKIYLRPDYYCKKHSIIFRYDGIRNKVTPSTTIYRSDFQAIDGVVVKNKEYHYRIPMFCVSRKVLEILLERKVANLRPMGLYLKESFVPVPLD